MTNRDLTGGAPEPLGVTPTATGINVAVQSADATAIELCLFDAEGARELQRIALPERTGSVFHGHIAGISVGQRYGLRAHGPFAPKDGLRFNPAKLLLDPYATAIDRPFRLHPCMFGSLPGDSGPTLDDSAQAMPKAIVQAPESLAARSPLAPWPNTILYELHVRGYTMRRSDIPEPLRGTFAGLAHPAAVDHLAKLGVTSVEILPCAAWIEERHLAALGLTNYWGYNPIGFQVPDPRLAPGGWPDIRSAVDALAKAGIETIVDVVFNHTGEGDALGPTVSLRGLDNRTYYRLIDGNPAAYVDDAGCGNVLALDRPPVIRLVMDSLRAWARYGGVHGFRFDLATTLGRRADGFDPAAPLLAAIAQDPELRALKLIAEPWDIGPGGYQVGAFPAGWGEWNDRYRDDVRQFWRGDAGRLGALATRLAGSSDLFAAKRRPSRSVNFVTAHDGFTLADLVAYAHKHNEANGENNRDGTDANYSWNHGVEGPAAEESVRETRLRDQRSLLATLLLSRGTPMLSMGAELGQSQHGNNNAYAQDNETTWLDWESADGTLVEWTRRLIALRRSHPAFAEDRFLTGTPAEGCLLPDIVWLRADGQPMTDADWSGRPGDFLAALLSACNPTGEARLGVAINRGTDSIAFPTPEPQAGMRWRLVGDSATPNDPARPLDGEMLTVGSRSVVILVEEPSPARKDGREVALDALARAAGIAGDWYEVSGARHEVSPDTKRALLAAMGFDAGSETAARVSLERLADERDRRALPFAATAWEDEAAQVTIPLAGGVTPAAITLHVISSDGVAVPVTVSGASSDVTETRAVDGRSHRAWSLTLPQLPVGRYRIVREDRPEIGCSLTIAPRRCALPPALHDGGRRYGLAAQLYAIRRDGDQGIGDFTTLAELATEAAAHGVRAIAINPLHALFPEQRERASPYQPSDRRFFDPIYLDLSRLGGAAPPDALIASASVRYSAVWAYKRIALERAFAAFDPDTAAFRAFVSDGGPALERFALFSAIAETLPGLGWTDWPGGLSDCDGEAARTFAASHRRRIQFHQYLQYLCALQWSGCAATIAAGGSAIGVIRDLAVGAAPDGAEVWSQPSLFARAASIGAPPDPLAPKGQVWGLPPPIPFAMERDGFAGFANLLKANMAHAGGLRIDHVMALTRLFWVPQGADGSDGAYVAYPLRNLLAEVTLASRAAGCLVVGEDLGTVPEGLRDTLADAGLLSYRVMLLEREGERGFRPPSAFPGQALACVTTHDLPTFTGWWEGRDIAERRELGLILPADAPGALERREDEKTALGGALQAENIPVEVDEAADPGPEMLAGAHRYVARSPAMLVMAQTDDLAGEPTAVNLPGTDTERPNWRRRLSPTVTELFDTPQARAILGGLAEERPG